MKKKILGLLLALCLVIGMLPVAALADATTETLTATIVLRTAGGTYTHSFTNNGQTRYYVVHDTKYMWSDRFNDGTMANADNYNLKIVFPEGSDTVELYMRNITNLNNTYGGETIKINAGNYNSKIIIESDCVFSGATQRCHIENYAKKLTFTSVGDATLTMNSTGRMCIRNTNTTAGTELVFENANLVLNKTGGTSFPPAIWAVSDVTISGGNLNVTNSVANCLMMSANASSESGSGYDLVIKDGAKVKMTQTAGNVAAVCAMGTISIDKSDVEISGYLVSLNPRPTVSGVNAVADNAANGTGAVDYDSFDGDYMRYFKATAITLPALDKMTAALNSDLDLYFAIPKAAVDADGYAEFVPAAGGDTITAALVSENENYYTVCLPNLAARQMTDTYTLTVYNKDGSAATQSRTFSIADYVLGLLRDEQYAGNAELKRLIVDMLVYGEMAQTQFSYNTDKPATADLTPEEMALATQTMAPCTNKQVTATGHLGTTFILESAIAMATAFDKTVLGEGGYTIVKFTNHYGDDIVSEKIYEDEEYSDATIGVFISKDLAAADGRCEVTWEFYNAENQLVATVKDSLESYTARAIAAGHTYVAAVMNYSDAAKAYFDAQPNA